MAASPIRAVAGVSSFPYLMQPTTSCSHCGAELDPTAAFCSTCGHARTPVPVTGGMRRAALGDPVLDLLRQITAGDYEIGGRLGVGGMASVYLAHELRLNRRVAIKAMLPELLQKEDMVERFFDEARKQARLEHRNIVPIYSLQWNAELPFFVMKFVDGFSTDDVIRARGALPIPVVQHILNGTIAALQYAHDEGVVHRDVKPGNVLIDRRGEPIVSDFGIAKAAESPHLTQTGAAIGTPAYMSPEQCRGLPVTPASDQYSVGIVAYQLLTGSTPFSGSMLDLLVAHTGTAPAPIVEQCPDCPPRLASAIMRMLEKSAEDRWPALRDALPDLLDGMGSEADARRQLVAWFPDRPTAAEALPLTPRSPTPSASRSQKRSVSAPVINLIAAPADGRWELEVGETVQMEARRSGDTAAGQPPPNVSWESNDSAVATVTADGQVTGHAPGPVSIIASEGGLTARCELTVVPGTVATIRIHPPAGPIAVGETSVLVAEALDARGQLLSGHAFDWSCNDSSKATITPEGELLALAPGEVHVAARIDGHERVARVTIAPVPAATVTITSRTAAMTQGETVRLTAEVRDADGNVLDDRVVRWESRPPGILSATDDGDVRALAAGDAIVSAVCEGRRGTVPIRVERAPVSSLGINPPGEVRVGKERQLTATVRDARGEPLDGRTVTWSSKDPKTLDVSATGVASGIAVGDATVEAECEGAISSVPVRVLAPPPPLVTRARVVRAGVGAGILVALAAIVFASTRNGEAPTSTPPAAIVAAPDSVPQPVVTTPDTAVPVQVVARLSLILTRVALRVGDSVRAVVRAFDSTGQRVPNAPIVLAASAAKVLSVDPSGLVVAMAPGTSRVMAQSGTAKASEAVTVTPRLKALSQSEAAEAIKPILALVSDEKWDDVQSILLPDVLEALKSKNRIDALPSGEPRIVNSTLESATVDFDVALTWVGFARRGRSGQALLRAKLVRADQSWRVTEVSAREKIP